MIKKAIGFLALIIFSGSLFASHLVGGSLGYEYVGPVGANFRYKIILTVYNNCDASSQIPLPVATQDVGVYFQDIPNNPMGGGSKNLFQTLTLNLVDSNEVVPPISSGCAVGGGVCIFKGVYEGFVDVPLNFNGYHLYFENFARNGAISNLLNPGNTVMAFHAYIPPTLVNNSSPVFQDDPVPFLCANDTASILNTAIDPDGDQLIFSFVTPMAGPNGGFGPMPSPLPWVVNPITYLGGFSNAQPFGVGGFAFIDGVTGLTEYMSPNMGNYVVAVEIREIRNGKLIGVSRRDLQLLVINCPPNPAPNLSGPIGGGVTAYTIQECDTLDFPVTFTDANGDSLALSVTGQVFNNAFVNPAATIDSLVLGDSTVTANFSWETSCGAGQPLPYLFTASVTDNGCPAKTTNVVYQITVEPPTPPDSIVGTLLVCSNTTASYTTDTINGYTFNWVVTGGTINSGQGSTTVNVTWGSAGTGIITVNGISDCSCPSASIDAMVTILAIPLADAGLGATICLGDTVQIGGSPTNPLGTIVSWLPNININNASVPNPLVFPTITTDYIVTVDNGTCPATDTVRVNVGSANIGASADTSICLGSSTQLVATGGGTYVWTPSLGLSNTTVFNPIANPIVTTVYTVTVTDPFGCVGIDTVIVTVNIPPTITTSNDTNICDGDCIQLLATGGVFYVWTPSLGLSNPNIANPVACPTATTTYFVAATNAVLCTTSDSIQVVVNPLPIISTNNDTSICIGSCVQLNATGGTSYVWTPTTGLSNPNIASPIACPLVTTAYTVTGTDGNGCFDTTSVIITINPLPIVDAGPDVWVCAGDSIELNATGAITYTWTPAAGLNNTTIPNPLAGPLLTTTYIVEGTDINGCSNTDTIVVSTGGTVPISPGANAAICIGDSIVLGGNPTSPNGTTYAWFPTGGLDDDTLANPTAFPTTTTTYFIVATNDTCTAIDSVTIIVNSASISAGTDVSICAGDSVQLTATGGISYEWHPGVLLTDSVLPNPIAFPTITTDFIVEGTTVNGCLANDTVTVAVNPLPIITIFSDTNICVGDSVQLIATGGISYEWHPGVLLTDSVLPNPIAFPTITTQFIVEGTDINGCLASDTVTVTVNSLPIITISNDTNICIGDSVQLTAIGGISYEWHPGVLLTDSVLPNPIAFPIITTDFIVEVTDTNGCLASDTVTVTVNLLPNIDAGADVTLCVDDSIQLNATGGTTYTWTPVTNLINPNSSSPIVFPSVTTTYIVTGIDVNTCSNSDSVIVSVFRIPDLSDTTICIGDDLQLMAFGPSNANYLWTPSIDLSDSNIFNPITSTGTTVTYVVTVEDVLSGCLDSTAITIEAFEKPVAEISVETTPACEGVFAEFTNLSTNASTYLWRFGDGVESIAINPSHIFSYGGNFTSILTAFNEAGCFDTTTFNISSGSFEEQFDLIPPVVFTPNGDGINDVFQLEIPEPIATCTNFQIFNRWGSKVFESVGQNVAWDGRTTAGEKVPIGTYFYLIEINGIIKRGALTLLE